MSTWFSNILGHRPSITHRFDPPIDMNNTDAVFLYTDDLRHVHRMLVKAATQRDVAKGPVRELLVRGSQIIEEYFDAELLESYYALQIGELDPSDKHVHDAHVRVIEVFFAMWGCLPSSALDDYRLLGTEPVSLSKDFIDEAICGLSFVTRHFDEGRFHDILADGPALAAHDSVGEATVPFWVEEIGPFYERFTGQVGTRSDDGEIFLDCLRPFGKHEKYGYPIGAWLHGEVVYCSADYLEVSDWGMKPQITFLTHTEIEQSYARRTNTDDAK